MISMDEFNIIIFFSLFFAVSNALVSLSIPINKPLEDNLLTISLLCPAPPRVPSTYMPSGLIFNPLIHSLKVQVYV